MLTCSFEDGIFQRITIILLAIWLYYTTLAGIYGDIRDAFDYDALDLVGTFLGFNYEMYVLRDINQILLQQMEGRLEQKGQF